MQTRAAADTAATNLLQILSAAHPATPYMRIRPRLTRQINETLAKSSKNQDLNLGEAASPDSFFPSFGRAIAELTNRGNGKRKLCQMEN
jgi:hypothetical protein